MQSWSTLPYHVCFFSSAHIFSQTLVWIHTEGVRRTIDYFMIPMDISQLSTWSGKPSKVPATALQPTQIEIKVQKNHFRAEKNQNVILPKHLEMYLKTRTENAHFYGFLRVFYGFLRVVHLRDWHLRDHESIYGIKKVDFRGFGYIYGFWFGKNPMIIQKCQKNVKNLQNLIRIQLSHQLPGSLPQFVAIERQYPWKARPQE